RIVGLGIFIGSDEYVDGGDAVTLYVHDYRIDVDLGDLGARPDSGPDAYDGLRKGVDVGCRAATDTPQQPRAFQTPQFIQHTRARDIRRHQSYVVERFDPDAPDPGQEHRAPVLIAPRPHDHFE